ncbi:MAG TPA: DNA-3-methyladenine glycosylase [Candidatus Acidoferrales bacterium]
MMAGDRKKLKRQVKSADADRNAWRARKTLRLGRGFFERPTLIVARELLGKIIVRRIGKQKISVIITETEAYVGEKDLASHARFGRTKRNAVMYGHAGVWYPYFIYGMHWMLNVTTEGFDRPAAVLIRAGILVETDHVIRGPGLLAKTLQVDASFYGRSATSGDLYFEDRGDRPKKIIRTPRIGIDYAGAYKDKKWRFVIPNSRSEIHFVK